MSAENDNCVSTIDRMLPKDYVFNHTELRIRNAQFYKTLSFQDRELSNKLYLSGLGEYHDRTHPIWEELDDAAFKHIQCKIGIDSTLDRDDPRILDSARAGGGLYGVAQVFQVPGDNVAVDAQLFLSVELHERVQVYLEKCLHEYNRRLDCSITIRRSDIIENALEVTGFTFANAPGSQFRRQRKRS